MKVEVDFAPFFLLLLSNWTFITHRMTKLSSTPERIQPKRVHSSVFRCWRWWWKEEKGHLHLIWVHNLEVAEFDRFKWSKSRPPPQKYWNWKYSSCWLNFNLNFFSLFSTRWRRTIADFSDGKIMRDFLLFYFLCYELCDSLSTDTDVSLAHCCCWGLPFRFVIRFVMMVELSFVCRKKTSKSPWRISPYLILILNSSSSTFTHNKNILLNIVRMWKTKNPKKQKQRKKKSQYSS